MLLLSKKEDEAYAQWLSDLKSQHQDLAPVLDQLASTEAGRELYRGGLRTADYYRRLNEFRDQKEELERQRAAFEQDVNKQYGWWQEAQTNYQRMQQEREDLQGRLAAYENQIKEYGVDPKEIVPQAPQGGTDNITQRELAELRTRVQAMDTNFPAILSGFLKAQQTALEERLPFDPNEVFKRVYQQRVDPVTAFNEMARPLREERAKELINKELEKAREEGRREALSKLSGPDRAVRPASPSVVDALRSTEAMPLTNRGERLDAAVRDFMEMELSGQA